jgi:prephenate dehydrogenase
VRIAVVGVGLIGGSVGMAARRRLGAFVAGYDPDPAASETALARGALDEAAASPQAAVAEADAAVVAVPVGALPGVVGAVLAAASEACVVTDVGSTKRAVVAHIQDERFVGGHPLAGAEVSGVAHAREDLFDGATWYLTPTSGTSGVLYERLHRMLAGLGARPAAIDANTHDRLMAAVSHLPHVIANVLVAQAIRALGNDDTLPPTGPSFRDATRVAGSNPAVWTDIYLANRDALVEQIDETVARLQEARAALAGADADAVARWQEQAAGGRRALLEVGLTGGTVRELRVAVPNRPGVVAELALELGRAGINISDMSLAPSPDGTSGVIALWIRDSEATRAEQLIGALGFWVGGPES